MKFSNLIQNGLLAAALLAAGYQFMSHRDAARVLVQIEAQIQAGRTEAEARRAALAAAEQHNGEVLAAEQRAGNSALVSLMRERAAVALEAAHAETAAHDSGNAQAKVLSNPDQNKVEADYWRSEMRANMGLFFKLAKLPPEKIDAYIDLQIEMEQRKAARTAALLRGDLSLADGLSQRDADQAEQQSRSLDVLGPEASAFLDSIADGMRNDEAKRQVNAVAQNMGDNSLSQNQSDRLQGLIKTNLVMLPSDDADLFRSPDAWTQIVTDRQQNILSSAATFLTPAQVETLKGIAAFDLAARQQAMMAQRAALGIK